MSPVCLTNAPSSGERSTSPERHTKMRYAVAYGRIVDAVFGYGEGLCPKAIAVFQIPNAMPSLQTKELQGVAIWSRIALAASMSRDELVRKLDALNASDRKVLRIQVIFEDDSLLTFVRGEADDPSSLFLHSFHNPSTGAARPVLSTVRSRSPLKQHQKPVHEGMREQERLVMKGMYPAVPTPDVLPARSPGPFGPKESLEQLPITPITLADIAAANTRGPAAPQVCAFALAKPPARLPPTATAVAAAAGDSPRTPLSTRDGNSMSVSPQGQGQGQLHSHSHSHSHHSASPHDRRTMPLQLRAGALPPTSPLSPTLCREGSSGSTSGTNSPPDASTPRFTTAFTEKPRSGARPGSSDRGVAKPPTPSPLRTNTAPAGEIVATATTTSPPVTRELIDSLNMSTASSNGPMSSQGMTSSSDSNDSARSRPRSGQASPARLRLKALAERRGRANVGGAAGTPCTASPVRVRPSSANAYATALRHGGSCGAAGGRGAPSPAASAFSPATVNLVPGSDRDPAQLRPLTTSRIPQCVRESPRPSAALWLKEANLTRH